MDQTYSGFWQSEKISLGLTFDDVLMVPQHSTIDSRAKCNVTTKFSKNVPLKIPLVSSPMDTVTEYSMAVGMARNGGLGIVHRYMSIQEQADIVSRVKRTESIIKPRPYLVGLNFTMKMVNELIQALGVKTFLVTDDECVKSAYNLDPINQFISFKQKKEAFGGQLITLQKFSLFCMTIVPLRGIITNRDLKNSRSLDDLVKNIMTPREKLVVIYDTESNSRQDLLNKMYANKIEKLIAVDVNNYIYGLVNLRDIEQEHSSQNKDRFGQLYVGAAVGAAKDDDIERAVKLVQSGCDVLVVDIANGHSEVAVNAVKKLREVFDDRNIDIVAGSIATSEGAEQLIKAGADGIRCGIGNGSICITRVVSGCGVPQFSALMDVVPICKKYDVPLISDGGNKNSGNMCKALAVGADCIMLGRLLAGCEESPSKILYRDGKLQKVYRGMAGYGANIAKAQRIGNQEPSSTAFTPEGVEGYIPYAGPLNNVLNQFVKGIQSGMSYSGASTIREMQQKAKFIRMTPRGFEESGVHDIKQI